MGQKTHPLGFRLGITRKWKSNWFNERKAADYLVEDQKIRKLISQRYHGAGIAEVNLERPTEDRVSIVIRTARPGIIIGKGGQEIDQFQKKLEEILRRTVKISIKEVEAPDLEAILVGEEIAYRVENRFPIQRAMKEVAGRVMEHGAKGIKIRCSGRLGGAEIARSMEIKQGRVPLQTIRADIDYGFTEAWTKYGPIGIKVWLFRGEHLPMKVQPPEKRGEAGAAPSS
ncbi:MAG: 30S ribosomal protein S3 [Candidatus Fraserbacteria bacterium RBG_16_55_9]|uniref:Small ribosomal subunit protein uS3 n=1 Tax=Fraserbacteria sp. (strain RBG_16_55_9) TaxID=1817864 RepID=A0A1F5UP95_FRAXR|nr:ribosomal protein S3 [uncultured bacterium]OGF52998.1 MAG: 30S ribosomal protein S3 [Candidatus Fraserbacteria bacterium RBG_16_55_9]